MCSQILDVQYYDVNQSGLFEVNDESFTVSRFPGETRDYCTRKGPYVFVRLACS